MNSEAAPLKACLYLGRVPRLHTQCVDLFVVDGVFLRYLRYCISKRKRSLPPMLAVAPVFVHCGPRSRACARIGPKSVLILFNLNYFRKGLTSRGGLGPRREFRKEPSATDYSHYV